MALEINAWVGNLGKYNEGELVGEWVTFPIDDDDWEEVMKRIGIGSAVDEDDPRYGIYEEIFYADYDSELPLYEMFGEYPTRSRLNELAEAVGDIDDEDVFMAILGNEGSPEYFDDALETYNSGNWRLYPNCDDMSDVAWQIAHEDECFINSADFMQRHFNFKHYGEELDSLGTFIPCGNGYLEIW